MTEISVVAQEIVASRQRGMPADEGKLWETLRLDAERAAMGEEILRGFLDLVVLRHDGFASALSDGRRSGDLHRPSPSTLSGSACPSRRCRDIDRATDATNPVSQLSCSGIIVVPTTGREKNPGRGRCPF